LRVRDFLLPLCMNILQATAPVVYRAWGRGEKTSFCVLTGRSLAVAVVCVVVPSAVVFAEAPRLVGLWLSDAVPPQLVTFVRCSLIGLVADALSQPLTVAINASGRVALYQVVASSLSAAGFLVAWAFLAVGFQPWTSMAAVSAANAVSFVYRYFHVRVLMGQGPKLSP